MRTLLALLAVAGFLGLSGCSSQPEVREIEVHIGYTADRQHQYMEPKEIRVSEGERFRLVITNDDKVGASDSFHDVAFRYAAYGLIEHEVPPGKTVETCIPQAEPDRACPECKDVIEATEKGSFKVWCEVGPMGTNPDGSPKTRHEQMGMWATLIVE